MITGLEKNNHSMRWTVQISSVLHTEGTTFSLSSIPLLHQQREDMSGSRHLDTRLPNGTALLSQHSGLSAHCEGMRRNVACSPANLVIK